MPAKIIQENTQTIPIFNKKITW